MVNLRLNKRRGDLVERGGFHTVLPTMKIHITCGLPLIACLIIGIVSSLRERSPSVQRDARPDMPDTSIVAADAPGRFDK